MIYLYVVPMDYAKSFWALHFTFKFPASTTVLGKLFHSPTILTKKDYL